MIGVFDSGEGGRSTLGYLRGLYPRENIVLLVDRKNSPYGKRSEEELQSITVENIKILASFGADVILIGCCTASGVWDRMNIRPPDIGVASIISPTLRRARELTKGKIAVIATEATVRAKSFGEDILYFATQELVSLIDSGINDASITQPTPAKIEKLLSPLADSGAELLILGCTHFGRLKGTIGKIALGYGIGTVIDSAEVGALSLMSRHAPRQESGMTYYLTTKNSYEKESLH
ncbi:MAG: aspartate/glutamate racemase family protein [Clostridia bacterium]|nr:aspartate/glutamate racemase family protein [Clostridia bacterium]